MCIGLPYVLARRHFGRAVAGVAAGLLAFWPVAVTASALTEAEFMVAAFLLGALLLMDSSRRRGLVALLIVCALAPLVKETGIVVPASVVAILLVQRRWQVAGAVAGAGVVGVGLLVGWGAFVDWHLFVAVERAQAARHSVPTNPFAFLMSNAAGYGNRAPFHDPVWYAGLLGVLAALCVSLVRRRRWAERVFLAPVLITAALFVVIVPGRVIYYNGWYRLTIYPLVYLAAAWLMVGVLRVVVPFVATTIRESDWSSEQPLFGHR